jgi:hypothetical protein
MDAGDGVKLLRDVRVRFGMLMGRLRLVVWQLGCWGLMG